MRGGRGKEERAGGVEEGARYGGPITEAESMELDEEVRGLWKEYAGKKGSGVRED